MTTPSVRFGLVMLLGLSLIACGDKGSDSTSAATSTSVSVPLSVTTASSAPESTTTTTTPTTAPGLSEESGLRFDGIGPVKVGMTLAQATAAVGKPVKIAPDYVLNGCSYAEVEGGPEGLSFMVQRAKETDPWRIVRVDVSEKSRIATVSGIRIGATEAEVKKTYTGPGKTGELEVEQHVYVEAGHYITYDVDGPEGHRLLFETDGTKVTEFRSGEQGPVGYVEGCA